MNDENIAYQNKDIESKVLAENFAGKSLRVYGLDLPKIVQVLPTDLPEVSANELRIDNLFLLEDGTIAIIDYESKYKKENRNKYLNYIVRVLNRYEKKGQLDVQIRMIVIYTADVTRNAVPSEYDVGVIKLKLESAFLAEINSDEVMKRLTRKVDHNEHLSDEELMEFIILPLTYKETERKRFAVKESFDLAKKLKDEDTMTFVLTGLLVFTDKIIDDELSVQVKEWIKMTKVGRLFAAEKDAIVAEKDAEIAKKDAALASKDAALASKDAALANKDAALANKDADLAKERARVKELEALLAAQKCMH